MRMIDEDKLIEESESGSWDIDLKELRMILKYVPTIDVAPVMHGEWIKKCGDGWYCVECSVCGHPPLKTAYGHADCESAFCPNCGCRMDGGEKHE